MRTRLETLTVSTTAPTELVDITAEVRSLTASSGVLNGVLTLISRHTTAYVNLNESEAELQKDMVMYLDRLVPRDDDYGHNRAPVDDRPNAHAHLLGLFMNASESIPIVDQRGYFIGIVYESTLVTAYLRAISNIRAEEHAA